jgi:hypothetical protein
MRTTGRHPHANLIRAHRLLRGIDTDKQLALDAHVSPVDFASYMTGRRPMPADVAHRIARLLDLPVEKIVSPATESPHAA